MIYFINLLLISLMIFIRNFFKSGIFFYFALAVMVVLPTFRSENVGTDTYNYILMFEQVKLLKFIEIFESSIDKGYLIFNYIVSRFFDSHQFFFLIFYLIVYSNFLRAFNNLPLKVFDSTVKSFIKTLFSFIHRTMLSL